MGGPNPPSVIRNGWYRKMAWATVPRSDHYGYPKTDRTSVKSFTWEESKKKRDLVWNHSSNILHSLLGVKHISVRTHHKLCPIHAVGIVPRSIYGYSTFCLALWGHILGENKISSLVWTLSFTPAANGRDKRDYSDASYICVVAHRSADIVERLHSHTWLR